MIIDFHTHTFPDKIAGKAIASLAAASHTTPFSDGTAAGLTARNREAGIDLAVVLPVATSPQQVEHINDRAAETSRLFREDPAGTGILSFGAMHPDYEEPEKELKRIHAMGIQGIKVHSCYQGIDLDDPKFLRIFDCCASLGIMVVSHTGWDIGFPGVMHCSPAMIRRVMEAIDPRKEGFTFVAAHMGGWKCWDEVPALADTGIYIDTAFSTGRIPEAPEEAGHFDPEFLQMLDSDGFMTICRAFGPERLLFGTDNPWSSARESLEFLRALPLSEEDLAAILGGNAARLLGL